MNVQYEQQGNYLIPCIRTKEQEEIHLGVLANRYRQYLKQNNKVRYYNFLTRERLYDYLDGVECQAEDLFEQTVKSLAEKEQVTEKLKARNMMLWVQKMNNIRNRATEIVNEQVIYRWEKDTTYGEKFRRLCLTYICLIKMRNLSEQTIWINTVFQTVKDSLGTVLVY